MISLKKCALVAFLLSIGSLAHAEGIPITNCSELQDITADMTADYYLENDINCKGFVFRPIGTPGISSAIQFSGTLDGGDKTISDLLISQDDWDNHVSVALFTSLAPESKITNLNFNNVLVVGPKDVNRGLIAAKAISAEISNIKGNSISVIEIGKKNDIAVSGGIVGVAINTDLSNIQLTNVIIDKNAFAGGLIGSASAGTKIEKSSVSGLDNTGKACNNAQSKCGLGGLIGIIESTQEVVDVPFEYDAIISESFTQGAMVTDKNIGGLIGFVEADQSVLIQNSLSNVNLCKSETRGHVCKYAGGIIGKADEKSFFDDERITLEFVYAIGTIYSPAKHHARAIVGHDSQHGAYRVDGYKVFFDKVSVQKEHGGENDSLALNTAQMKAAPLDSNFHFTAWDKNVWTFSTEEEKHYPMLTWSIPPATDEPQEDLL